jgi:hypothetical protein
VEGVRVVLFDGCGHYPHHEQPERFMLELRDFLDDPAAPKARLREARGEQRRSRLSTWLAPPRRPHLWQKGAYRSPLGRSTRGAASGTNRPSEASSVA